MVIVGLLWLPCVFEISTWLFGSTVGVGSVALSSVRGSSASRAIWRSNEFRADPRLRPRRVRLRAPFIPALDGSDRMAPSPQGPQHHPRSRPAPPLHPTSPNDDS